MDYIALGQRIRDLRRKRGLTQEKLAELVDLSVPYISHLERGTKKPSLAVLIRLAECFGRYSGSFTQWQSGKGYDCVFPGDSRTLGRLLCFGTCCPDRNRLRRQKKYPCTRREPPAIGGVEIRFVSY